MKLRAHQLGVYASLILLVFALWNGSALGPVQASPTNLIRNGTFDVDLSDWNLSSQTYSTCVNTSPIAQDPSFLAPPYIGQAAWLNACGGPTDRPEISQTIGTDIGATYVIAGYAHDGAYGDGGVFAEFRVLVNGAPEIISLATPNANGWAQFSVSFTATSSSTTVGFRAEEDADTDYFIDSVSMIMTSPATTTTTTPSTTSPQTTTIPPSTTTSAAPSITSSAGSTPMIGATSTTSSSVLQASTPSSRPEADFASDETATHESPLTDDQTLPRSGASPRRLWNTATLLLVFGCVILGCRRIVRPSR